MFRLSVEINKVGEEILRLKLFSAIYASPDSTLRKELERIRDSYKGPWMLAGDFNETTSMSERIGSHNSEMQRFLLSDI